ncbi:MAG TPA: helix-turn-helix domain-containing protein [Cyclobacteriaceae bacterium]|jgi:HTH-type transcriptional regulator/antitoxin HigA|nr:helix-turn-helix domain-containing protein [Cyclobacteriaceae bacterium]
METQAIRVIRSKKQYQEYLDKIDKLMDTDPSPNSVEGQLLETLTILVEDYERKQGWELPTPKSPIEVIKIRMNDLDLKQSDLVSVIGDKTVVSRILNGSRKLTYSMVNPLSKLLGVPPEFLLESN